MRTWWQMAGVWCLLSGGWGSASSLAQELGAPVRSADREFGRYVKSWRELRQQNVVMQRRDFSCGAAALATLVRYYWGEPVTEQYFLTELDKILTFEEAKDRILNGLTLTDLRRAAVAAGYQAAMGKLDSEKLAQSRVPVVVGITVRDYRHFVVYRGTDGQNVYLADPIRGNVRTPRDEFEKQWQENAVLVVAKPGQKVKEVSPLSVRSEDITFGELNQELIQKNFLKTPSIVPLTMRP